MTRLREGLLVFNRVLRLMVLFCIKTILKGTHAFRLKAALMRLAGYRVGAGAKVVGPINISTMCELTVGENSWIGTNLTVHGNGVVAIGDNCDVAPDVTFLTGTHVIGDSARRAGAGRNTQITVGNGCWLGARSTLVGQLRVGESSILGACSFANNDVEPNSLTAGVPAKKVRSL